MIGPSRPTASTIGPSAPAPPTEEQSDSDDDFGPALPPDLVDARANRTNPPVASEPSSSVAAPPKRVLGPSLPPTSYRPPRPATRAPLSHAYSDDDQDQDGPMPLPAGARAGINDGAREFREREEREEAERRRKEEESRNKSMKREEWMLTLPEEVSLLSSMDTTKLKSRTFAQATPHSSPSSSKGGPSTGPNLWTETPAERIKRLEDEMLGLKSKAEISNAGGGRKEVETEEGRRKRVRDRGLREEVEKHNKSARSTTLLDSHSSSSKRAKKNATEDEPEAKDGGKEIWDRDRDMSITGRLMEDGARADVVKQAKELGGRFGGVPRPLTDQRQESQIPNDSSPST